MSLRRTVSILMAVVAFSAAADPPREDVEAANRLFDDEKYQDAIKAYRSLQIDDPESELLYYNIGCAQLKSVGENGAIPVEILNAAKSSFDKAATAARSTLRRDSRYNRINCESRLAALIDPAKDYKGAVRAFEDTIYAYEDFLDQYPGHSGAQKNKDHARYQLKVLQQDPPPEEEQQDTEKGEDGENQDGDQQDEGQSEGSDEQEGERQDPSGEQASDEKGEQQQQGDDSEEGPGEDQQEESGEDPSDDGESGADTAPGDEESGDSQSDANAGPEEEPAELPSRDTIDAILDALQERDRLEQQKMRNVPQNPRRSGPWW